MIKKELFFHQQTPFGRSLGFSAIFVPCKGEGIDDKGNLVVWMATTFCNKKDRFFNKKIARKTLRDRPLQLVKVKDIPYKLGEVSWHAYGLDTGKNAQEMAHNYHWEYNNVLRHFV